MRIARIIFWQLSAVALGNAIGSIFLSHSKNWYVSLPVFAILLIAGFLCKKKKQRAPLEIERRWLLKNTPTCIIPPGTKFKSYFIHQFYLPNGGGRVRQTTCCEDEEIKYYHTKKIKPKRSWISKLIGKKSFAVEEYEREITHADFAEYMKTAKSEVHKKRFKIEMGGKAGYLTLELDEFIKPNGISIAEVEIPDEKYPIDLFEYYWLHKEIIKEITGDDSFSNFKLSEPLE